MPTEKRHKETLQTNNNNSNNNTGIDISNSKKETCT